MSYVAAALVLVGSIALLNLLLTLGLIRRMREQAAALSSLTGPTGGLRPVGSDESMLPAGSTVRPFSTTAIDGTVIDNAWFDRPTLVGFFSPGCKPCAELRPRFIEAAARTRALAVIDGTVADDSEYRAALAGGSTVVAGEASTAVVAAFDVQGFPSACLVDENGVITEAGTRVVDAAHTVHA
ncbi:TlpA family protein disulfide reductase [Actinoplanes utahensis]|uniref:TlpA family protein disulfide reductase n=1 Tax=Actinoplanes utahensis TaxID=1869 RepID=UPI00068AE125|nr:hypothetical protein [Actinoplanes utahensis]GIF35076.1 hypothetical protein Aut01nite_80620 [Actinoplanes utahensis]